MAVWRCRLCKANPCNYTFGCDGCMQRRSDVAKVFIAGRDLDDLNVEIFTGHPIYVHLSACQHGCGYVCNGEFGFDIAIELDYAEASCVT